MMRVFAPYFVIGIVFKLVNDTLLFIQPYLLGYVKPHVLLTSSRSKNV